MQRKVPSIPKDSMFAGILNTFRQAIYRYHEHDSLLENKPDEDLSEAEKKEAWDTFEIESRLNSTRLNVPQILNNPAMFQSSDFLSGYRPDMVNLIIY
jgi:transcriptional regulator ATRX